MHTTTIRHSLSLFSHISRSQSRRPKKKQQQQLKKTTNNSNENQINIHIMINGQRQQTKIAAAAASAAIVPNQEEPPPKRNNNNKYKNRHFGDLICMQWSLTLCLSFSFVHFIAFSSLICENRRWILHYNHIHTPIKIIDVYLTEREREWDHIAPILRTLYLNVGRWKYYTISVKYSSDLIFFFNFRVFSPQIDIINIFWILNLFVVCT